MNAEFEKTLRANVAMRISEIRTEWAIDPGVIQGVEAKLRHAVKMCLGTSCMCACWSGKAPRDDFLQQIPENLWLAIILALRGHLNSANVAVRQANELFLKHIYFLHHPVEFEWVQKDDGIREFGFQMLSEYLKRLQGFDEFSERDNCLNALSKNFSEASRYVHVHSAKFFGRGAFGATKNDAMDAFKQIHATLEGLIPTIVVLCAIYQYPLFRRLNAGEHRLVVAVLPPRLKAAFAQWRRQHDLAAS